MSDKDKNNTLRRREFMQKSSAALAGITIVPSHVISGLGYKAPSDKLNIVGVGVGGRGGGVLKAMAFTDPKAVAELNPVPENMMLENIVGLCDVDWKYSKGTFESFPKAKKYKDWRVMFEEMDKEFDAVVVGTPNHTHAIVSINAMKMGKHVYCEKPLTHSVHEARMMTEVAREYGVATQMGNQGNSGEGIRQICEWFWDGAIGEVEEVHAWTNRPIWPQGLERPAETMQVPETLAWDLFLGPAPSRPYHEIYTPWNWRAWWDFGTGALGDMACHILDPVFKAMKLQYPIEAQATSSQINTESAPIASTVQYVFPARKDDPSVKVKLPQVKVTWYDGGLLPPRPEELPDGQIMGDWNGGCLFVGTKGKIICGCYAANPMLLPKSLNESYNKPKPYLRRIENHQLDWVRACKEKPKKRVEASSSFDYAGPLTEMVLMGNLAIRLQDLKRPLKWDGKNMKITNVSDTDEIRVVTSDKFTVIDGHPHFDTKYATINAKQAAEEYVKHNYREGWTM